MSEIVKNLEGIRQRIENASKRSGRSPDDVTLIAVTKTYSPKLINEAIDAGVTDIGENKVQEFLSKKDTLHLEGVEKHLIGHLQTNKVKKIVSLVDMIQSVDSVHLAEEISKQAVNNSIVSDILFLSHSGSRTSHSTP